MEEPCRNRILIGTVACRVEPVVQQELWLILNNTLEQFNNMLEQSIPKGLSCVERIYAGTVIEELHLVVRTNVGAVCEGLYPVGGISC